MSIKTKDRIVNFGEVFTSEREVSAMLDLVYDETQRIDSRFLEPACGNGNFLTEVLCRKLDVTKQRYKSNQLDFERNAFQATGSVYGIDILKDNVDECRKRMLKITTDCYVKLFKDNARQKFLSAVEFVLSHNILWGNALTLKGPDGKTPITFSEWSFSTGNLVKRVDYALHTLLSYQPIDELAYQPMEGDVLLSDLGKPVFFPKPIKEYQPIHFLEIPNVAQH